MLDSDAIYEFAIEPPCAGVYGPNNNQNRRSGSKALYEAGSEDPVLPEGMGNQQTSDHKDTTLSGLLQTQQMSGPRNPFPPPDDMAQTWRAGGFRPTPTSQLATETKRR